MMETLTVGLEWFTNPDHLPLLVGLDQGWFRDTGLQLELVEPQQHLDAVDEIEHGRMDLAITEPLHLVEDAAENRSVVGFARFLHTNGGVMYLAESDIERPRGMAGTRIQYPGAPGPGGPAIVETMIRNDGGECDTADFSPVNNGFYHTDALIEDRADVATLAFYNFEILEARYRGHDADFFALKDWGVPDFCQLIFVTHPDTVENRSHLLTNFLEVLERGLDFLHQNPGKARQIYFEQTETDLDNPLMNGIFDATVPCFTLDFQMTTDFYSRLAGWMAEHDLIETIDAPSSYWTNKLTMSER